MTATLAQPMTILIVTGVSGAGKTTALRALEDIGYYCVDNLPLPLIGRFVELLSQAGDADRTALVVDAREGDFLQGHRESFAALRSAGHKLEVLYLTATDEALMRRYSETRRRHPLSGDDLRQVLLQERALIAGLREAADAVVDTGNLNVHQLKGIIHERYGQHGTTFSVSLVSFGYKHGLPSEADMVLDVRFLPNPYFIEALSARAGTDPEVADFVLRSDDAVEFIERAEALLGFLLPRLRREGKGYFTLAIGCTGGRHRSVAVAEALAERLRDLQPLTLRHRDLLRGGG